MSHLACKTVLMSQHLLLILCNTSEQRVSDRSGMSQCPICHLLPNMIGILLSSTKIITEPSVNLAESFSLVWPMKTFTCT